MTTSTFPRPRPLGGGGGGGGSSAIAGRLRVEGRFFRNDTGDYRWQWSDALAILSRPDANRVVFLDYVAAAGFNGVRVFCGTLTSWATQTLTDVYARLPVLLYDAAARGLYVEATLITGSAEGWNVPDHVRRCNDVCAPYDNVVIEMANEPYHGTQSDAVHDAGYLYDLSHLIDHHPVALGAAPDDESLEYAGGDFVTAHLDRGRDQWNMVRRVRELENVSASTGKPCVNNEPIKAGSQNHDPDIFFTFGVLNRTFEVPGVQHSDHGLTAVLPTAEQAALDRAFIEGSAIIPTDERLVFKNAGWPDSPIASADFDACVRVYTGVAGNRAWTTVLGITGDPKVVYKNNWRPVATLTDRGAVRVLELAR